MIEHIAVAVVLMYAVIAEIRWFNADLWPNWWNPFSWR